MVEVFKTDVKNYEQSLMLVNHIHSTFLNYQANFDLEDCDRILRIKCPAGVVHAILIIEFLKRFGCHAEVLKDEVPLDNIFPSHVSV